MRIVSEPVHFNLDPRELGRPVANAIAHHLRERVKGISAVASDATIKARAKFEKAMQEGKSWAAKRYAGGKMGPRQPNQSNRLFNDSGRFAESITAGPTKDGAWAVNLAANRLDPNTANGGVAAVERIFKRLLELVPEFGNAGLIMQSSDVVRAMVQTQQRMIRVGKATDKPATIWDAAKAFADVLSNVRDVFVA